MLTVAQVVSIKDPEQLKLAKKFVKYNALYDAELDANMEKGKETSARQERCYDVAAEAFKSLNKNVIKVIQQTIDTTGY